MQKTELRKGSGTSGLKGSEGREQPQLMKTARAVRPFEEQRPFLKELMPWFKRTDGFGVIDIAVKLDINCGSAYSIIQVDLIYHKICSRCVSELLADEHQRPRVETCMHFLAAIS